jgi:hypothetical protein
VKLLLWAAGQPDRLSKAAWQPTQNRVNGWEGGHPAGRGNHALQATKVS